MQHRFRWWEIVGGVVILLSPLIVAAAQARSDLGGWVVVVALSVGWFSLAAFGAGRAFRHH